MWREDDIVDQVPFNIASVLSPFLRRDCNQGFMEVTGEKVNRGALYGLEIPFTYKLCGPKPYIERLAEIVQSLQERCHGQSCPDIEPFFFRRQNEFLLFKACKAYSMAELVN